MNPLLPRPKGAKDAEGMKSKFLAVIRRFYSVMPLIVPYLPLNPLLPRPKGAKDAEGMKSKFLAVRDCLAAISGIKSGRSHSAEPASGRIKG